MGEQEGVHRLDVRRHAGGGVHPCRGVPLSPAAFRSGGRPRHGPDPGRNSGRRQGLSAVLEHVDPVELPEPTAGRRSRERDRRYVCHRPGSEAASGVRMHPMVCVQIFWRSISCPRPRREHV